MKFSYRFALAVCILALAAATCPAQTPEAATTPEFTPQRIVGRVVNTGSGGGSAHFNLQIDELITDGELASLKTVLSEEGEEALIDAMENMQSNGWMRIADSIRYNVAVINAIPTPDGGRIIRVVTNRSLAFGEVMNTRRSRNYRFGIVELTLDKDGNGEGSVIVAARIRFNDEDNVEIESFGTGPIRLLNIQTRSNSE